MDRMSPPRTVVAFRVPYRLSVGEDAYDGVCPVGGYAVPFRLRVKHIKASGERSKLLLGATGDVNYEGDQLGISHVSSVEIELRGVFRDLQAKEAGCACLNHFLDVVRYFTRDFRIKHVRPDQELLSFRTEFVEEDSRGGDTFAAGNTAQGSYPAVETHSFEDVKDRIKDAVSSPWLMPLWDLYRLEARRSFEERQFAVSVILMSSALEFYWAALLRDRLLELGRDESQVKIQMNTWLSNKKTLPTLDRAAMEIFGRSLAEEAPNLWNRLQQARDTRKSVLHPWPAQLQMRDALKCLAAHEDAIQWLIRSLERGEAAQG